MDLAQPWSTTKCFTTKATKSTKMKEGRKRSKIVISLQTTKGQIDSHPCYVCAFAPLRAIDPEECMQW